MHFASKLALLSVVAIGVAADLVDNPDLAEPITSAGTPSPTTVYVGLGEVCSGSKPDTKKCLPGLVCSFPMPAPATSRPVNPPEILGVCIRSQSYSIATTKSVNGCGVVPVEGAPDGCIYPSKTSTVTRSPSPTSKIVGLNEDCGGFIPYPNVCATGFICKYPDPATLPTGIAYEGPGKCVYPTKTTTVPSSTPTLAILGEKCGGSIPDAKKCIPGLICVYPKPEPTTSRPIVLYEGPGVCAVPPQTVTSQTPPIPSTIIVGLGERCGGFTLNPVVCRTGLQCMDLNPMIADLPGVCIDPKVNSVVKVGVQYPCDAAPKPGQRVCDTGLVCTPSLISPPGSSGLCQRPTASTRVSPSPSPTAEIVGLGESCGGFTVGPPPQCAAGLVCKHLIPIIPDLPGVCINPKLNSTISVGRGYPCDLAPKPGQQVCNAGLICTSNPEYAENFPDFPEMKLTCEPAATTTKSPSPTVGYCAKKYNQCGGNLWQQQIKCCPGTTCKFVNSYYSQCI